MFKRRKLSCSFCGKEETEVRKLVAGAQAYICDECVAIASRIMADDTLTAPLPAESESSWWRRFVGSIREFLMKPEEWFLSTGNVRR